MEINAEKIVVDGKIGWRLKTSNFEVLRNLAERVQKRYSVLGSVLDTMHIRIIVHRENEEVILVKDESMLTGRADITEEELEKIIDLFREAKRELYDTKITKTFKL